MTRIPSPARRSRMSCSLVAMATAMVVGASPAAAQSFQGSGTFTNPAHGTISTSPNTTSISVNTSQAVIDWLPTDNGTNNGVPIVFQPSGTTAEFSGSGQYAVLNRINVADASRVVELNGTIKTVIQGVQQGTGSIYFYSPSGFVLGGSSVINVGSLVLSASPILVNGSGEFVVGADRAVTFGQAINPNASITTNAGSQITAAASGSYVAMVAPRVTHLGAISVEGQAALVGAEAATVSFSPDGLFDIQVTSGTSASNGVVVGGDITGGASTGAGDNRRIYMVAVPKNDAMTMLIQAGSDLGFDVAGAANVDGNAVILSAGHDIADGTIQLARSAGGGSGLSDLLVYDTDFTSRVDAAASNLGLFAASATTANMASNLTLRAANAQFNALNAGVHQVAGSVTLNTTNLGAGPGAAGGEAYSVATLGGTINITGDLVINAQGIGTAGLSGTGGNAYVSASSGGTLNVTGTIRANVDGIGGAGAFGRGGIAHLDGWENATISAGSINFSADGHGGADTGAGAGIGYGGEARLWAYGEGAQITIADVVASEDANLSELLSAEGFGGLTIGGGSGLGGEGRGGTANVWAEAGGSIQFPTVSAYEARIVAHGTGGDAAANATTGGAGIGGSINLTVNDGTIAADSILLGADGNGGSATGAGGFATGGAGQGGTAIAFLTNATVNADGLTLTAHGTGGSVNDSGGVAGNGVGGTATVQSAAGTNSIILGSDMLRILANGTGGSIAGAGSIAGHGTGGNARLSVIGGSTLTVNGNLLAGATGEGGDAPGGTGGNGVGGSPRLYSSAGTLRVLGTATLDGRAFGGDGDVGGDAIAKLSDPLNEATPVAGSIIVENNGLIDVDGVTTAQAGAIGGAGANGAGGDATGGEIDIVGYTGTIALAQLNADVGATGGNGGLGGAGGFGQGGQIDMTFGLGGAAVAATLSATGVALTADGQGGAGGTGTSGVSGGAGGAGGNGVGGSIGFTGSAAGGMLSVGSSSALARGFGGAGGAGGTASGGTGGAGGAGGHGSSSLIQTGTISASGSPTSGGGASYASLTIDSSATGGAGGNGGTGSGGNGAGGAGGNATGGQSSFLARGVLVSAGTVQMLANATGGNGGSGALSGNGGNATTGFVSVESKDRFGIPTQRGTLTAGTITASAVATEGVGATNGVSTLRGGSSLRVQNGDATIGSVTFNVGGDTYSNAFGPDYIMAKDGSATITGTLSYTTTGNLALYADNGSLTAGNLVLSAGDFVDYPGFGAPALLGTFFADTATITTGNNFHSEPNLDINGGLSVTAPGAISVADLIVGSDLMLWAQGGGISADLLDVGGLADLTATGDIGFTSASAGWLRAAAGGAFLSGDISSDANIQIYAANGITTGNLVAGVTIDPDSSKAVRLESEGSILVGTIVAAGGIDFSAGGSMTGGNITTGDGLFGDADGALVLGNISAGLVNPQIPSEPFSVGVTSETSILVGNVDASLGIGFGSAGGLTAGNLTTGGDVLGLAGGDISLGTINAGGRVYLANYSMYLAAGGGGDGEDDDFDPELVFAAAPVATGGSIALAGPVSAGSFQAAAGTTFSAGAIASDGILHVSAGTGLVVGNATAGGDADLGSDGNIAAGNLDVGSLTIQSVGNTSVGSIDSDTQVYGRAAGTFTAGDITAGTDIDIRSGGAMALGDLVAGDDVALATLSTMTGGDVQAGGLFIALGRGDMSFGDATASEVFLADYAMLSLGGADVGATCVGACGTLGPDGVVTAPPNGSSYSYVTTEGGASGAGQIPGEGGSNGSLYTTSAFSAAAGDDLAFWFNYVTSDGSGFADYAWAALLTANLTPVATLFTARTKPTGTIVPGQDLPGVEATLEPASVPIIPGAPQWSALGGSSGSCYSAGCGYTGWISSTYEIAEAGNYVVRFGVSNWSDTSYQSGMAFSGITVAGSPVSSAPIRTAGSISIGDVNTGKFTAAAGVNLTTGIIDSSGAISLDANGAISTGNLFAGDFVLANGGSISVANVDADSVDMTSTGGNISAGNLITVGDVHLDAFGDITVASANAGGEFDFSAGGSVNGGNIVAGEEIGGNAAGSVTLANLTAGVPDDDDFSVGIAAIGNITVQNVSGPGAVGFATQGNLQTGNLNGGGLVMTLVGGNITTGSITTGGESGGQVYMADDAMFLTGGGTMDGEGDFNPATVLALDPVATGGSITINGPVTTGLFQAATGQGFTAQAITAGSGDIAISAGATATVNGAWTGSDVDVTSNDINIASNGSIDASDILTLTSTNATQALIGDGLAGGGYALSNAEFGRLEGGSVYVFARGDASAAQDMLIGNLTVTGPSAGSTIEHGEGTLVFGVGDFDDGIDPAGVIRVAGNVSATGFGAGNAIAFVADRFELDAATGSVSVPGSEIGLYADRIHVAAGSILDQLAANPAYAGYQQDLNQPASVQRPEGVLRADTLWIESDNLQGILIQNTGTAQTPAGFLVREAYVNEDSEVAGPPGSIDLIVNGQVQTEGGTLTGVAARDALVDEETDTTPFTANSTINGCPLTGACRLQESPPPPNTDVVNEIAIITLDPLGDSNFGNESDVDDNEEGDEGASNPISPPHPLFDTRPLVASGDINDPVSGSGNPALLGTSECEEGEDGQCPAPGANGDGQ